MRSSFELLADSRFRRLFLARSAAMWANAMAPVVLAFAVLRTPGAGVGALSLILVARQVTQIAVLLVSGAVADRFPRTRVMALADTVAAVGQVGLGLALASGHVGPLLIALAALTGAAPALFFPAAAGVVPQLVPRDRLKDGNALLRLSTNTAMVVGAGVAGPLVIWLGGHQAVVATGLVYLISAALLIGIRFPPLERRAVVIWRQLRDGWHEVVSRPWLWVLILHFSVVNAVFQSGVNVLGPVVADASLGGPAVWSIVLGGRAAGMIGGTFVALRLHPSRPLLAAVIATFGFAPMIFLLARGGPVVPLVVAAVLVGTCVDIFTVMWDTTLQQQIPEDRLSRVSAYDVLGSIALSPVTLALIGPLQLRLGVPLTLTALGGLLLVSSTIALAVPSVRHVRALTPGPASGAP